jgi:predicted transcriptional regulator
MSQTLARLFSALSTLEHKYGLAELDPEERAIFGFIAGELAEGRQPAMQDVVAAGLTPRSTAYRKVANLKDYGLIEHKQRSGIKYFAIPSGLRGFSTSLKSAVNSIDHRR